MRKHPQIDPSGFPDYPDEPARRGSSRGAVPNGNPWRPIDPNEKPGRDEAPVDFIPDTLRTGTARPHEGTSPAAPIPHPAGAATLRPAIVIAINDADERIGHEISDVLANSKSLEGIHLVVEVLNADVYLRGTVPERAVKHEVERLCSTVKRVARIYNEIDIGN
ncbi:MAG: BON domain-containing protein [Polyangiaceae bacterium]